MTIIASIAEALEPARRGRPGPARGMAEEGGGNRLGCARLFAIRRRGWRARGGALSRLATVRAVLETLRKL